MNPDLLIKENPFPDLLNELAVSDAAVVAPAVVAPNGFIEDSVRHFPSLMSLCKKLSGHDDGRYGFRVGEDAFSADWVAGMFMLFQARDFKCVGGFDENFFLYYEDVDICARLRDSGRNVLACPKVQVVHLAQRASRRNLRYFRWHLSSLARYFSKYGLCGYRPAV